jgi:carboxymethylenebutenolidase
MHKSSLLFACILAFLQAPAQLIRHDSLPVKADTITFSSGNLQLKGLFWKPEGKGPFPAILFNHGSEPSSLRWAHRLAGVFVTRGYIFFMPFRRGQTLSQGQGRYIGDAMDSVFEQTLAAQHDSVLASRAAANLAIQLHEKEQLQDQLAGLKALLKQPEVDKKRIAVSGISFGGIQTMLMAAQKTPIKCAVNFAGAAMMWNRSAEAQQWMKSVAAKARIPVQFVQAENDFSIEPSKQMADVMKSKQLPHELRIYPPSGTTNMQGHGFVNNSTAWFEEVFAFLDKYLKKEK